MAFVLLGALAARYADFLRHLRRTVAQAIALDGEHPSYETDSSSFVQPGLNPFTLHAGLVVTRLAAGDATGLGGYLLNPVRPLLWPFAEYLGLQARLRPTRWRRHNFALSGPFGSNLRLCALQAASGALTLDVLSGDGAVRRPRYLFAQLRWRATRGTTPATRLRRVGYRGARSGCASPPWASTPLNFW